MCPATRFAFYDFSARGVQATLPGAIISRTSLYGYLRAGAAGFFAVLPSRRFPVLSAALATIVAGFRRLWPERVCFGVFLRPALWGAASAGGLPGWAPVPDFASPVMAFPHAGDPTLGL